MQHPNSELWIARALDELDAAALASAEAHLQACVTCRMSASRLDRLLDVSRRAPSADLPVQVLEKLLALQKPIRRKPRWQFLLEAAAVSVAAVLLFLGGVRQGRQMDRPESPATRVALPPPPLLPIETHLSADWLQAAEHASSRGPSQPPASPVDSL